MIKVRLRIPLERSFLIIKVEESSPTKIMQSLESMVKAKGDGSCPDFG